MDDLFRGFTYSKTAEKLQDAIITLLASACFDIRVSSDSSLISGPATFRETEDEKIIESLNYPIETLGIRWNRNPDQFDFKVKLDKELNRKSSQNFQTYLTHSDGYHQRLFNTNPLLNCCGWTSLAGKNFTLSNSTAVLATSSTTERSRRN